VKFSDNSIDRQPIFPEGEIMQMQQIVEEALPRITRYLGPAKIVPMDGDKFQVTFPENRWTFNDMTTSGAELRFFGALQHGAFTAGIEAPHLTEERRNKELILIVDFSYWRDRSWHVPPSALSDSQSRTRLG
jgi:hypothetical protein